MHSNGIEAFESAQELSLEFGAPLAAVLIDVFEAEPVREAAPAATRARPTAPREPKSFERSLMRCGYHEFSYHTSSESYCILLQ